jgi:hypothetical protein
VNAGPRRRPDQPGPARGRFDIAVVDLSEDPGGRGVIEHAVPEPPTGGLMHPIRAPGYDRPRRDLGGGVLCGLKRRPIPGRRPMNLQQPSAARARLDRLDVIGVQIATRGDVIALLGVGSVGVEHERLDEHSDLDFFVVVDDGAKQRYIDSIDWLEDAHHVAYSFVNDPNGRKALFADGIFVEYAVFTLDELDDIPFIGARVVWSRDDAPDGLPERGRRAGRPFLDTVEFHLNEALTNLFVGMHRELRGERLTATRFIQSLAVDRVLALLRLTRSVAPGRDPFDATRRVEQEYPPDVLPLGAMIPGYGANVAAAAATLAWLREHFDVDPVVAAAIDELVSR